MSTATEAKNVLIMSTGAGGMTDAVEKRLRDEFSDFAILPFDHKEDFEKLVPAGGTVVVAGGDGTIGHVVRKFADSKHPIGIIPLGTFNNFAHALGLPLKVGPAIEVIRQGRPSPITLGRINGKVFLEAAALGLFGETIALGESAKDRRYGTFVRDLRRVVRARLFDYEMTGDIEGSGTAMSLVFNNTSSIGAQMPISDKTPIEPYLELSIHAGARRADIVKRVLARVVLGQRKDNGIVQVFRFRKLKITAKPRVRVYADNKMVGLTPVKLKAEISAVKVILPR